MGKINFNNVQDPDSLEKILRGMHSDIAEIATLANEVRTDHATFKAATDGVETLIEELHDDHTTFKTAAGAVDTLIEELHDDHATQKTSHDVVVTLITELRDDHATLRTWGLEQDSARAMFSNILSYLGSPNCVTGGSYTFAAGAAVTITGAGNVFYRIGGEPFYCDLDTTITLTDDGDIIDGAFGAWRILIDAAGVVTTQSASIAAAAQAHVTAEDALLTLASIPQTANTACLGYFVGGDVGAAFNIGTVNLTDLTNKTFYYERGARKQMTGLAAALGAATVATPAATTLAVGTIDPKINGIRIAQIAANGVDVANDDASTIGIGQFGGFLLVTDLAGTGTYCLAATGIAGAVSAMTYATAAAAIAAVGLVEDNLPVNFCPICRIIVQNGTAGVITVGVFNWNAALVTTTVTDCGVAGWNYTSLTGFNSHQVYPLVTPVAVTAAIYAAITAGVPAAGPDTLTAPKPADAPATLGTAKPPSGPATITAPAVTLETEV